MEGILRYWFFLLLELLDRLFDLLLELDFGEVWVYLDSFLEELVYRLVEGFFDQDFNFLFSGVDVDIEKLRGDFDEEESDWEETFWEDIVVSGDDRLGDQGERNDSLVYIEELVSF